MKNSIKYVTISLVMIFAVLFLTMTKANASGMQLNFNGIGNTNTNSAAPTGNTNTNAPAVNSAVAKENLVTVNQINDADKDIPKTGESDVYIVAGIAIVAVAVGAFAFMKSNKYKI